jgi:hypothetical protein
MKVSARFRMLCAYTEAIFHKPFQSLSDPSTVRDDESESSPLLSQPSRERALDASSAKGAAASSLVVTRI